MGQIDHEAFDSGGLTDGEADQSSLALKKRLHVLNAKASASDVSPFLEVPQHHPPRCEPPVEGTHLMHPITLNHLLSDPYQPLHKGLRYLIVLPEPRLLHVAQRQFLDLTKGLNVVGVPRILDLQPLHIRVEVNELGSPHPRTPDVGDPAQS